MAHARVPYEKAVEGVMEEYNLSHVQARGLLDRTITVDPKEKQELQEQRHRHHPRQAQNSPLRSSLFVSVAM